jgi:tetratricopeptide (TPR) repeat protein
MDSQDVRQQGFAGSDNINNLPQLRADQSRASQAASQPPSAVIALAPWSPDRPYLRALDSAATGELDRVFAEQQAKHGGLPAFWLDVAEWHFRKGRRGDALTALLSALELPTRNSQTLSIVAERLIRYGELDRAIFLLERLAAGEADRPQPKRTLALALAKRAENGPRERRLADFARAISLLTDVIMTPWDDDYEGVEMIALMEVNRLIPNYRALGGQQVALDSRLVALLDVDIRVVIEWNSEATDIDLWVDEPNGERAIYNNPRTAIGGRLSNDMTSGFGPEEYLLRRAPNGSFTVRAHVYAADRINPNGASSVTARLIRDYGRPTQSEQVIDIELLPDDRSRERLIGKIDFRR